MWRSIFSRIWNGVKWLFGMSKRTRLSPAVYQAIHFGLVVVTTLLLAWFSPKIVPDDWLPVPTVLGEFIRRFYCGILFLLFYAFVRLTIYLIGLFRLDEFSEFQEIDLAWAVGVDALARNGLDVQMLPLFLVAGATGETANNLFAAARAKWVVSPDRDQESLVLHFYADSEAVFVVCRDVGALACQVQKAGKSAFRDAGAVADRAGQAKAVDGQRTVRAEDMRQVQMQTVLAPLAVGGGHTLMPGQMGHTMAPPGVGEQRRPVEVPIVAKLDAHELRDEERRLEYLCRLIARERDPFCPINGLQVVVPLAWSASSRTQDLLHAARQDVETLHRELEQRFPVVCLYSGLEELPGVKEFIERGCNLDRRFRESRAGSRFPMGRPVDDHSSQWVVERAFQWFQGWIYAEFAKDLANEQNTKLYRLLCELDERRARLVRQLTLVFGEEDPEAAAWLAGCYLVACGADGNQRAFVQGVLQKQISDQDNVIWSDARLGRDRRHRRWATGLFTAAGVLAAADVSLLWLWLRSGDVP